MGDQNLPDHITVVTAQPPPRVGLKPLLSSGVILRVRDYK